LGGQGGVYLAAREWRAGLAYRSLSADRWYVGKDLREDEAPFGHPLFLNIYSADVTIGYGITDRLGASLTIPSSYGTHSRYYADGVRHKVSAGGLGDVSLSGNYWLFDSRAHVEGNIQVSLGVKTPSGKNDVNDDFFLANGSVVQRPVDQAIQLGDGGWGVLLQIQAFQKLFANAYGYATGSYLVSPRNTTDVASPIPGVTLSVPDVYSARTGLVYSPSFAPKLSVSLGGRLDGIPLRDLTGGSDGFRRPAIIGYVDPGVVLSLGRTTISASVPFSVYRDFRASLIDRQLHLPGTVSGGDLATYLVFVEIDRWF
jgi:hypothetical protein